ncbi:flagellin [Microbacterium sp. zg.Y1090]|uniref:flagellin N-terminal helical domain-containing protein n=1 Tax=Microbacterium TaxID=33882 RepID=UPI00214AA453|nr:MULTISPECIES: flagellin [unclassified Microbacterium]MCR2813965.1 flagellin [Microbacterium sp. zg.Y1084]MCR2819239.1 flagellin [Microbacterium sp. zg.Y1090]MDL5487156.1 flagellin [Microbacterium sp. zg-Y1211]WIM28221.1 flagellin [Microbacterium sp. zg-Y1090]
MGMQITTNVSALNAYRNLSSTQNDLSKSLEKLSSGLRINRAADDAAGLAISEGLKSQVNGLNVAQRNAQDGISVIQTAEGALTEVHSILQRMRDLAVQAGNGSNNAESRTAIQTEVTQLTDELVRIADSTNFNGISLLKGGDALSFQVGANGEASSQITVATADLKDALASITAITYGADTASSTHTPDATNFKFDSAVNAALAITAIDTAIEKVSTSRADLGAAQNRMESTINSLAVSAENLSAAKSRITDTDMASEMVKYTAANILSQAGTAMLAQANQSTQGVLQLLR